jgi:hypothetical protein
MDKLRERNNLKPCIFHVASEKENMMKYFHPSAMQQLIKQHAEKYSIGIHPCGQVAMIKF